MVNNNNDDDVIVAFRCLGDQDDSKFLDGRTADGSDENGTSILVYLKEFASFESCI